MKGLPGGGGLWCFGSIEKWWSGSIAAAKPQGQALRVLAYSQPCPFPPATLHLQVAKAERRSASGGAQTERLIRFQYDVMAYANGQIMTANGQIYWCVLYKNAVITINYEK